MANHQAMYLPFFYLEKVKRPGERYLLKVILADDLFLVLLAFSWISMHPVVHALSMLLLLISFWCIYEIGYCENDLVAEKFENKPILSLNYQSYKRLVRWWQPWLWSLIFSFIGIFLLEKSQGIFPTLDFDLFLIKDRFFKILFDFSAWIGLLLITRFSFWIYNYLNKQTRIWLYPVLHLCRYFGFLAITPTDLIGTILILCHILSYWIPYLIYRHRGGNKGSWPKVLRRRALRCYLFIFVMGMIAFGSHNFSLLKDKQTLVILLWCLIQASLGIRQIIYQIKPIWKDGSS